MVMISIIVPVYNVRSYLLDCVESLLSQKYKDYEILLIDDGSDDGSGKICDEYILKNKSITVIHQKNGGLSAARNTGIKIAQGKYLTFIDSDDYVSENYLKVLIDGITNSKSDISSCGFQRFEDNEKVQDEFGTKEKGNLYITDGKKACLDLYTYHSKIPMTAWAKLIKRELFNGIEFPPGKLHEDVVVTPRLLYSASKVAFIDSALYYYRQRTGSIMNQDFSIRRFDSVEGTEANIKWLLERGASKEIIKAATRCKEKELNINVLTAYKMNKSSQIPRKYKRSEVRAILRLKRLVSDEVFEWYMNQFHPEIAHVYSYILRLKKIGIRKQR